MLALKPFDLAVALKIGLNEKRLRLRSDTPVDGPNLSTNSVGDLALALARGKGDVSRAIVRLISLGLISERRQKDQDAPASNRKYYALQRQSMIELLCFGIRHVFQSEKSGVGRGLPTGWNCPFITSEMNPPNMPLVWPMPGGPVQGELTEPLYPQVTAAAMQDDELYGLLALIDVIRTGKPRELVHAKKLVEGKIMELYS